MSTQRSPECTADLIVEGPTRLTGTVRVSGFKHAFVTTVAASLTSDSTTVLSNCPDIVEARVLQQLIQVAGGRADRTSDQFIVDPIGLSTGQLDSDLSAQIHGSVYLLPALVARFGAASVVVNGGCQIGSGAGGQRPVEHYREIFSAFGADSELEGGRLHVSSRGMKAANLDLSRYANGRSSRSGNLYSGATKMALLCAACADGSSMLFHPYDKADVSELVALLRALGAEIKETPNLGSVTVRRAATPPTGPIAHRLILDLVEIVTWIAAAALYGHGALIIAGNHMMRAADGLREEFKMLGRMGISMTVDDERIVVHRPKQLNAVKFTVSHSNSIFSDCHPFFSLLAASADGTTQIEELVWPDRFDYVEGLRQLGVDVRREGAALTVFGGTPPSRSGEIVQGSDLRAAAVLLLAALGVPGKTIVSGAYHLERGYPDLPAALRASGANVQAYSLTKVV
jgi:UDP-N-acetylglucosamine 1-carboxyvinyltransferase